MKLSVSLTEDDVAFLDRYARERRISSRSGALQDAVALLRATELGVEYAEAWAEWVTAGEAELWEATATDGIEARPDAPG